MFMIENPYDPQRRLTTRERKEKRVSLMEDVDEYIQEIVMYCDDEEDLIALGSLLQVLSKNVLTSVMDKGDWRHVIDKFTKDVEKHQNAASAMEMIRRHLQEYIMDKQSVLNHIKALEQKHQEQEDSLSEAYRRPQTPEWLITTIKKRKLKLKTEIERLKNEHCLS